MAPIHLDANDVNKVIADVEKFTESVIAAVKEQSTHLRKVAEDHLKTLHQNYNNPIKAALEAETNAVVRKVILEEFRPKIEAMVREKMTDEVVNMCAEAAWKSLQNAISNQRY